MEGGGPEAGLMPHSIEVIRGRVLAVEAESCAQQTVVAPAIVAAAVIEPRTAAGGSVRGAERAPGDAGRASSVSGHPCQDHVNHGPQEQTHSNGDTESYN